MKKIWLVFSLVLFLSVSFQVSAQWYEKTLPYYGLQQIYFTDQYNGFITGDAGQIYKTTDGGSSWTQLISGTTEGLGKIFSLNQDTIYVCGSNGNLLRTLNAGDLWQDIYAPLYNIADVYFSSIDTGFVIGNFISGGNEWPIFEKTTNGGATWANMSVSGISIPVSMFFIDNLSGIIANLWGEIAKSTDGGISWITYPDISFITAFRSVFFINNDIGYATGMSFGTEVIFKTINGGISWDVIYVSDRAISDICFVNQQLGYAVTVSNAKILKTTDAGQNWVEEDMSNINMEHLGLKNIYFVDENFGYVLGYRWWPSESVLLKTGEIFVPVPVELTSFDGNISGKIVNLFWSTATELNNNGFEIERSIDNTNWATIGFVKGAGTTSEPQQYNFIDDVSGFSSTIIYYRLKQLDFNGTYKYSYVVEVKTTPTDFALKQNYPNPFNPSTKISWQSPVGSWQTLKIYDILGNEVATLVDEYRNAGSYDVEFPSVETGHAPSLPSGVYFYQLRVGNFIETKKMILLK